MKSLNPSELRGKERDELVGLLLDLRSQQFNLRMRAVGGAEVTNPLQIRFLRRNVARVLTELHRRAQEISLSVESKKTLSSSDVNSSAAKKKSVKS